MVDYTAALAPCRHMTDLTSTLPLQQLQLLLYPLPLPLLFLIKLLHLSPLQSLPSRAIGTSGLHPLLLLLLPLFHSAPPPPPAAASTHHFAASASTQLLPVLGLYRVSGRIIPFCPANDANAMPCLFCQQEKGLAGWQNQSIRTCN